MTYNCRVYDYPTGQHVTIYRKSITRSDDLGDKGTEDLEVEADRYVDTTTTFENEEDGDRENENENEKETEMEIENEKAEHSRKVSLSGTKNRIYNISRSNIWEWFVTLTFDREKTDASDYDVIVRRLKIFLNHLQQRQCPELKYLIVPELHADKKHYHFHGLLSGCSGLRFKYSGHLASNGQPIFNILNWKWGYTTATRVYDTERVSSYITKYITKDVGLFLKDKHRYYASRNVNRVEPRYFIVDEEDFLKTYADSIVYSKTVVIKDAYQQVNYYEIR